MVHFVHFTESSSAPACKTGSAGAAEEVSKSPIPCDLIPDVSRLIGDGNYFSRYL